MAAEHDGVPVLIGRDPEYVYHCFRTTLQLMMSSSTLSKESHVDVLIIGAGPAGVMCANALVQAGVTVRVVDKR